MPARNVAISELCMFKTLIVAVNFHGIPEIHFQLFKIFLLAFTFFSNLHYTLVFMSQQHEVK
jgi:hypothetical protein